MPGWVIPNLPDADVVDLAEPDAGDFLGIAHGPTGVISGGVATATSPASMNINVTSADVVINGEPLSFLAGSVVISASAGGQARFDLIVWTAASGLQVVTGTPSANPVLPVFDPTVACLCAAVYVGAGVTQIVQTRILSKQKAVEATFKRRITQAASNVIDWFSKDTNQSFRVTASGKMSWGTSTFATLERISDGVMRFLGSLVLEAVDAANNSIVVLKARSASPVTQKLWEAHPNGSTTPMAYLDGTGRVFSSNFRFGTGNPEGVVTAPRGTLYVDDGVDNPNLALWYKTTTGTNTGWRSFKAYDPSESALPTGVLVSWVGRPVDALPVGFILASNTPVEITADTQDLADLVGTRFGAAPPGFFIPAPLMTGKTIVGVGGPLFPSVGSEIGVTQVTLSRDQMPNHSHGVNDPGHKHPQQGDPWYYRSNVFHNNQHPFPSTSNALPHLYKQDSGFNRTSVTDITISADGGGQPFSIMQPSVAMTFLVKL